MRSVGLRIAIVEDQRELREGVRILVEAASGFRCTGAYATMEDAIRAFEREAPDVVLIDIGLPGISGIEGTRILKQRHPTVQVVILTVYDDDERIFQALCAGALGYLLKNTPPDRLLESIREIANGGSPVSPEIARRVFRMFQTAGPDGMAEHSLTPHERRILKLLVEGHNYKTAAGELGISVNTVSFHVRHIYEKLQVHSKSEAVAKALKQRLIR
jgi:DNA-binding NarL/FixJ family response regulator